MILSKNIKKKGLNFMKIKEIKEKIKIGIFEKKFYYGESGKNNRRF